MYGYSWFATRIISCKHTICNYPNIKQNERIKKAHESHGVIPACCSWSEFTNTCITCFYSPGYIIPRITKVEYDEDDETYQIEAFEGEVAIGILLDSTGEVLKLETE